jgi:hypothetical protein
MLICKGIVTQEELFKASLFAKNEEISKIQDILKGISDELTRELVLVHKLNAQVGSVCSRRLG